MSTQEVSNDDIVVLIPKTKGQKLCLRIKDEPQKIAKLGVYNSIKLLGKTYGSCITLGRNQYWLLPSKVLDHLDTMTRKAQIILPKDSALIALYCNLSPGANVIEGGLGSGALTIFLLSLVGASGKVTTYEKREDFAKVGKRNIENACLSESWVLKMKDITKGISEKNMDAVILDIPEPWLAVDHAHSALSSGGALACYVPTTNQVEKVVKEIQAHPFIDIHTHETLHREMIVGSGGIRPSFEMLGHTGYITVAKKVLGD
jgi:tRNA (adenine57-N1/adenine58-N1)-methyltransferase